MKTFHQFLCIGQPFRGFPSIFILSTSLPFHEVTEFLERPVSSPDSSCLGDDFTLHNPFTSHSRSPSISSGTRGGCSLSALTDARYGSNNDTWNTGCNFHCGEISSLNARSPFLTSNTLNGPCSRGLSFFVGRLVLMFLAFNITKSPTWMSGCCWAFRS